MTVVAKADRDRFVAFAFTAADVLVEIDAAGVIGFAAGALQRFAPSVGDPCGQSMFPFFAEADRHLVEVLLRGVARGGRAGPIAVRSAATGQPCDLSVLKAPLADRVCVTLSGIGAHGTSAAIQHRDEATGLLPRQAFADVAEAALLRHLGQDTALELSIVRLGGLDDRDGSATTPALQTFLGRMAAVLRAASLGGNAAADLGSGRFAVLHTAGDAADRLEAGLEELLAGPAVPAGLIAERQTLSLDDASLTPSQASAALHHVLDQLERSDGQVEGLTSLAEALAQRLADTAARVRAAKAVIEGRHFYVVYQPVVDLAHGCVHHSEALTRLRSKEPIYDFVTFAEAIGFIVDFDYAVTREVLDKLARLGRNRLRPRAAVNISARSLESDVFVERLLHLCKAGGATAKQMLFEITESFQIADLARADNVLQALRKLGHQVCLDDFGAGAAAFHYIRALTVDHVKLDGAFVQRVLATQRDAAVLRSMVDLCRSLEVETIAEMVETEAQVVTLRQLGVTFGQGFGLARPGSEPPVTGTRIAATG